MLSRGSTTKLLQEIKQTIIIKVKASRWRLSADNLLDDDLLADNLLGDDLLDDGLLGDELLDDDLLGDDLLGDDLLGDDLLGDDLLAEQCHLIINDTMRPCASKCGGRIVLMMEHNAWLQVTNVS